MGSMSLVHWVIVGIIVLVLFGGGGKITSLMGDFAKGIKSFKKHMADEEQNPPQVGPVQSTASSLHHSAPNAASMVEQTPQHQDAKMSDEVRTPSQVESAQSTASSLHHSAPNAASMVEQTSQHQDVKMSDEVKTSPSSH